MNLYDEAIEELQDYINEYGMDYYATNHFPKTIKAIERAKKEHELLGLYQYLNENTNDYDLNPDEVDEIHNKIYELEEELK